MQQHMRTAVEVGRTYDGALSDDFEGAVAGMLPCDELLSRARQQELKPVLVCG